MPNHLTLVPKTPEDSSSPGMTDYIKAVQEKAAQSVGGPSKKNVNHSNFLIENTEIIRQLFGDIIVKRMRVMLSSQNQIRIDTGIRTVDIEGLQESGISYIALCEIIKVFLKDSSQNIFELNSIFIDAENSSIKIEFQGCHVFDIPYEKNNI